MNLKVGDEVKLLRNTRHNMVCKGTIGKVVEIRNKGCKYTDGVSVEFIIAPSAVIAKIFGKDPNAMEPWRCLFPPNTVHKMLSPV